MIGSESGSQPTGLLVVAATWGCLQIYLKTSVAETTRAVLIETICAAVYAWPAKLMSCVQHQDGHYEWVFF